jgi:ribonuclease P protein component
VFKQGRGYRRNFLYLKVKNNDLEFSRFGIIVSKKISNKAVVRNQIKRRLREAINNREEKIKKGMDIIIVALEDIKGKKFDEIDNCVEQIFDRARII